MSATAYVLYTDIQVSNAWAVIFRFIALDSDSGAVAWSTNGPRSALVQVGVRREDAEAAVLDAIDAEAASQTPPVEIDKVILLPEFRKIK